MTSKALVVLSGGQDSTTCLFWALQQYGVDHVYALTFDYNQRHALELQAATTVARFAGIAARHEVLTVGSILAGTSPLTDPNQELEQYQSFEQMDAVIGDRVEKTFVPMRNALFLTIAANRAVVLGCNHIVTGVCQADNANYPDCRSAFIESQQSTINEALGLPDPPANAWDESNGMHIVTPLMDMTKAESIRFAIAIPGAYTALAYTHTAYSGEFPPTGNDHATVLRAHGFEEADVPDPLVLRAIRTAAMPRPKTPNYRESAWVWAMAHIRAEATPNLPRWWGL